jgi:Deoxynucleoside kinase
MLIVEGPDGAGKSTLVGRLVGTLGWEVASKVVDSNTKASVDLVQWVERNVAAGLQPRIFDRHRLISEPIYGPLLRGDMEPGFNDFRWLRQWQGRLRQEVEPLVIFCLPPLETVKANLLNDANNKAVAGIVDPMYWLYFNAAASWGYPSLVWDYTRPAGFDQLIADVKDWAFVKGLYP